MADSLHIQDCAAVLLCAGKGTRMNDSSRNKVSFDCAGDSVIRRIVRQMRQGGVNLFAVVVGYRAETVMAALSGEEGVFFVYQKDQKGTGDAARLGLAALKAQNFRGKVLVAVGDRIVSSEVISGLLSRFASPSLSADATPADATPVDVTPAVASPADASPAASPRLSADATPADASPADATSATSPRPNTDSTPVGVGPVAKSPKAVFGVQPLAHNPRGGHVLMSMDKPCGIVEMADVRRLSDGDLVTKAGVSFSADQVRNAPYANASLYCFDLDAAVEATGSLTSDNAQKEFYLTDTLEYFAIRGEADVFVVRDPESMSSFSTKPELRSISTRFMRNASSLIAELKGGGLDKELQSIYGSGFQEQKPRYIALIEHFISRYGDRRIVLTRAPGRVNLMGRHIDHRGGGINVMAIDRDLLCVSSPREDDSICLTNTDAQFPDRCFRLSEQLPEGVLRALALPFDKTGAAGEPGGDAQPFDRTGTAGESGGDAHLDRTGAAGESGGDAYLDRTGAAREPGGDALPFDTRCWLDYLASEAAVRSLEDTRGDWANYVKAAVLRLQFETPMLLSGMDMAFSGSIPVAAGLSSSSAVVVASAEAVCALNCLNITQQRFIELCGEGEWFVGSRGGAGDHAAMKCSRKGCITHLDFKPFRVGERTDFSDEYAVIVADTCIKSRKSEGSRDIFNSKVAASDIAFMILRQRYPEYGLREFRDLADLPSETVYKMMLSVPHTATREELRTLLPEYSNSLNQCFSSHADPGAYDLRSVALFGIAECLRSRKFQQLLSCGDYLAIGEMMKTSHLGDAVPGENYPDSRLEEMARDGVDLSQVPGGYRCSTQAIDALCRMLDEFPGVLGSQMVGAGLGGCVVALVRKDASLRVVEMLRREYYDKNGLDSGSAHIFVPSSGTAVIF
ncbi:MAG: galactokinase family protein [Bacteroidales bacterium]|nr:galactokinase family protein [Bacteroidales bacterium]